MPAPPVDFVVMDVAQCDEIVDRILPAILVVAPMVQFQHLARIIAR